MHLNSVINVLILDDSVPFQTAVRQAIGADAGLSVVGTAAKGDEAKQKIEKLLPDVMVLSDIPQEGQDLDDFIIWIRSFCSTPMILIGRDCEESAALAKRFSLEFVRYPDLKREGSLSAFCNEICVKIKISVAGVKSVLMSGQTGGQKTAEESGKGGRRKFHLIAIGASTGGTEATAEIMANLPEDMPGIVIVQHMPADFTRMYAERLDRISRLAVSEAKDGDRVEHGKALVAAGGKQMILKKDAAGYYVKCLAGERVNGHCPSVGVLFDSVAETAGSDAIGVILTGMGRDGADGLLNMRKAGAYTIGQDRDSCVVYGMPMAAYEVGAVMQQAPSKSIAGILAEKIK